MLNLLLNFYVMQHRYGLSHGKNPFGSRGFAVAKTTLFGCSRARSLSSLRMFPSNAFPTLIYGMVNATVG